MNRHIEALPAESGAHDVVVRETITFEVEGLPEATQVHQYVMDRSTNVNLNDGRAWAYESSNVLDRAGAYWIAMPADVDTTSPVRMYKDEIGATFRQSVDRQRRRSMASSSSASRPASPVHSR